MSFFFFTETFKRSSTKKISSLTLMKKSCRRSIYGVFPCFFSVTKRKQLQCHGYFYVILNGTFSVCNFFSHLFSLLKFLFANKRKLNKKKQKLFRLNLIDNKNDWWRGKIHFHFEDFPLFNMKIKLPTPIENGEPERSAEKSFAKYIFVHHQCCLYIRPEFIVCNALISLT